jgi:Zn-finger nucleic acid-binding protein
MLCPIDKITLDQAVVGGVEVDYCHKCFGLWFEEEELRWAKDYKDRNLRWLDIDLWKDNAKFKISLGKKLCPKDRLPLYEMEYGDSGIEVDICNICKGVWLDKGEFQKIIQYLRKTTNEEVLNNYLKNLREELWEIFAGPETFKEEINDFLVILKLLNYKLLTQYPNIDKIISHLQK